MRTNRLFNRASTSARAPRAGGTGRRPEAVHPDSPPLLGRGQLTFTSARSANTWRPVRPCCRWSTRAALNAFESAVVLVRPCWVRGGSRFSSRPFSALVRRNRSIVLQALGRRTCTPVTGRKRGACPGTSAPTTLSLRDELVCSRRIRPVRGRSGFAARLLRVLFSPSRKPEAIARTVRRRHSPGPVRGLNAASSGSASAGRNALSRPGPRGGCTSAGKGCPGHRTRL